MIRTCLNCDVGKIPAERLVCLCDNCLDEVFPEGLIEWESVTRCSYCGVPREWKEMISTSGGDMCADCQAMYAEAAGGSWGQSARSVACTYSV